MNWLDLGILLFVIIFVIIGIKKGLMTSVLSHFSFGLNCLISFFLSSPIKFIYKLFHLDTAIYNHYYNNLIAVSSDFSTNLIEISQENLKSTVNIALNNGDFNFISKIMFKLFLNNNSLYDTLQSSGLQSRTLAEIISQTYSSFYLSIISFVTSLILVFLVVLLFKFLVNKLRTVGFIKIVDNIMGCFYGLFRCFIIFIIICLILKLLSPFSFMDPIINYINGSLFGKLIYSQINKLIDSVLNFSTISNLIT